MQEADRIAVGFIGFSAWQSSSAFDDSYLDPAVIERVRGEFEDFARTTNCDVVVAEIDGNIVGWGARDGQPHYISDLWVHPQWQGHGIGRALIDHFLASMRSAHLPYASIGTHARNHAAIRLYERCGFETIWRGTAWSKSMQVELERVRMQKMLG